MKVFNAKGALEGHTSFGCRRIARAARDHGGMASSPRRRCGSAARTKSLSPTLGSLSSGTPSTRCQVPGPYGIGAARNRSGIARTWRCSRFRIGSTKIRAWPGPRLTCSRITKLLFPKTNNAHGRSRDTQVTCNRVT